MMGGFLITLREGLEAFLVVGIILSYLGRAGASQFNKWIYLGVGLGLLSAFALALFFQLLYTGFDSKIMELYVKIGIMAFAVAVLTYMTVWMTKSSHKLKQSVELALEQIIDKGSVFALVFMAYLAVLREGFETVLFLGALYGDNMAADVLYGGMAGLVIALFMTIGIFRGMRVVPLKTFFTVMSTLILLIAAGLLINMIGMMQDLKLLPVFHEAVFNISWLMNDSSKVGIFFKAMFGYTSAPSMIQIVTYLGYIALVYWLMSGKPLFVKKQDCSRVCTVSQ